MTDLPKEFVIYDTEYTSWEGSKERGWSGPNEHKELIQLGAIKVKDLVEVDSLLLYIKPTVNPELSQFIIKLTGVTQADVDSNGVSFSEAYEIFSIWKGEQTGFAFGLDDQVMQVNHDLYQTGITIPEDAYGDIRVFFNEVGIDTAQYMSSTIPEAFGLIPPPAGHDALNDTRSILMALKARYTTDNV